VIASTVSSRFEDSLSSNKMGLFAALPVILEAIALPQWRHTVGEERIYVPIESPIRAISAAARASAPDAHSTL
jgi:hypothetical protein